MTIVMDGDIAFLPGLQSVVSFSKPSFAAFSAAPGGNNNRGTQTLVKELNTALSVAPWGEDNRFPQHITNQLDYCGVAKRALRFKAAAMYGQGIVYGKVTDVDKDGNDIFTPARKGDYPEIDTFFRQNGGLVRFYAEFLNDWTHFENCFPEAVLTNDGKRIARWVHQESCDVRYKQMDAEGRLQSVYLSKLWGAQKDQFVKYKKEAAISGSTGGDATPRLVDGKYIKQLRALDMYNALEDLQSLNGKVKNVILPVNFPSTNKTYYQLASWDGARLSGWLEIASKIPAMFQALYENAFNIKYHIEFPETYFSKKHGDEVWEKMTLEERKQARLEVLTSMNNFLKGAENQHKAFISYFDMDRQTKQELGHVKITAIDNKSIIDKDLMTSNAADRQIITAIGVDPAIFGAGMIGGPSGSAGSGSDKREAWLIYLASLYQERQLTLEPLRLTRDYNGWDGDLEFRFRDTILTTLNTGAGTDKKLS